MRVCEVMVDLAFDKAVGAGGWCGGGVMAGIFCDDLGWCGWLWCCLRAISSLPLLHQIDSYFLLLS